MIRHNDSVKAYAEAAAGFAKYKHIDYTVGNLAGEVGEVMSKLTRDGRANDRSLVQTMQCIADGELPELREQVIAELGDVAWQWFETCRALGVHPNQVLQGNLDKLSDRQNRNVIVSAGDNR